jgi:hypothetical protein
MEGGRIFILKALVEKKGTAPEEAIKKQNLILVWCRGDYEYQVKGSKRTIQWLVVRTDFEDEKITGKELEQLFADLEKDPMAQACWINKEMNKVVIARIYD